MAQFETITCKCGSVIAACLDGEQSSVEDWQKNAEQYLSKGCKIEFKEGGSFVMQSCNCLTDSRMSEVIYCNGCGAMFAACSNGHQDEEWIKDRINYMKEGCRVEYVFHEDVRAGFSTCKCNVESTTPVSNQLELFQ